MVVLVLGGSGLVGRAMIELLEKEGIAYIATYNSRPPKEPDARWHKSSPDFHTLFTTHKPSVCINCIVQRQVDACESNWNETKAVNIDLVGKLATACLDHNVHLIHISSDYVFDGKTLQNAPDSPTNPLQNYGISKCISESRVIRSGARYTIVRVPVLYWDAVEHLDESAVTLIGKKVLNQIEHTKEDNSSIRRPIYIPDMCRFLLKCAQKPQYGIRHFYNPNIQYTKYKIATIIADIVGKPHAHIQPVIPNASSMADRPYDTDLYDPQYDLNTKHMDFTAGIRQAFTRFIHPPLLEKERAYDMFLMFDLDGTLVDSDRLHYESYKHALGSELSWDVFESHINTGSIDRMLETCGVSDSDLEDVKKRKKTHFLTHSSIQFMPGAEVLLEHCLQEKMNIVIVTNTSAAIVEHFKAKLPLLQQVTQWIVREDYVAAKPSNECYELALAKYYKGEPYTIGFENTIHGYHAIRNHCQCVYFITNKESCNYDYMKTQDVYLSKQCVAKNAA